MSSVKLRATEQEITEKKASKNLDILEIMNGVVELLRAR